MAAESWAMTAGTHSAMFVYPRTLDEALAALDDPAQVAIPIGGATALAPGSRRDATVFVDITRCGLDDWTVTDDAVRLGTALRAADIAALPLPGALGDVMREAAGGIATRPLRNAITLGGNIVHMQSWSDLPLALLALDATADAHSRRAGVVTIPLAVLADVHPVRVLPPHALLTTVSIPRGRTDLPRGGTYQRFRLRATDYPLITVAVVLTREGRMCREAAIGLGAVAPRPIRLRHAESLLRDVAGTTAHFDDIARTAAAELDIMHDPRMEETPRRRILATVLRRALMTAWERAQPTGGAA